MRTLSADWMANTSRPELELQSMQRGGEESNGNIFYPRPVAPTTAQVFLLLLLSCFVNYLPIVSLFILVEVILSYVKCTI